MLEARRIAHTVLVRVERGGAFANRALDAAIRSSGKLDSRDVGLATELSYGTLRRQVFLDHVLSQFSKTPLPELDFEIRALLRLGAYQLLNTRIPPHAALHATVELSKEFHRGRATKFVNGVLRSLSREQRNVQIPPASVDPETHLALTASVPHWLAAEAIRSFGFERASALLESFDRQAPLSLRVNRLRGTRDEALQILGEELEIRAEPTPFSPDGLLSTEARFGLELLRPEHGRWQAQDEAAQLIGHLASPAPGSTVLDACAAPGGKTCHLAELMDDDGRIDAADVHQGKLKDIDDGARRLGLSIIRTHAADASLPLPFAKEVVASQGGYDLAMVDAPCSGLGTMRRHPELKTRRTAEDVERLARLQSRILDNVAPLVRPGGVLVYAVCTFTRSEGPEQIERFLQRHPEWRRQPPPERVAGGAIPWEKLLDARGDLDLAPDTHGTDAFFAARLVRGEAP